MVSDAGYKLDSVSLVRMCGAVSTSFSEMAMGIVAQFLNRSKSILNAVSRKRGDDPWGGFSA